MTEVAEAESMLIAASSLANHRPRTKNSSIPLFMNDILNSGLSAASLCFISNIFRPFSLVVHEALHGTTSIWGFWDRNSSGSLCKRRRSRNGPSESICPLILADLMLSRLNSKINVRQVSINNLVTDLSDGVSNPAFDQLKAKSNVLVRSSSYTSLRYLAMSR